VCAPFALFLAGCIAWVRFDGRIPTEFELQPILLQCQGQAALALGPRSAETVMQDCMTRAGYFLAQLPPPR
jgi:hypothetical protein